MRKGLFLFTIVLALARSSPASAARLSFFGAANFSTAHDNFNTPYTADQGFGFGGAFQYPLKTNWSIELTAMYLQRKTDQQMPNNIGGILATTSTILELELLVRWTFVKLLSKGNVVVGFGPYYAYYPGSVKTEGVLPRGYVETNSTSYLINFRKRFDGGIVGAVATTFPLKGATSLLAEFRYTYGMVNGSLDPQASIRFNDVQILLGLSFETTKR